MGRFCRRTVALALSLACACSPPSARTNIVLVVVDTLRADAALQMPNLLALAADGVAFEHAFSHSPITLPAHTTLFSSRHPYRTGVVNNGDEVPSELPLLADWLGEHGYHTHAVTSLATMWPSLPGRGVDRGFDTYPTAASEILAAPEVTRHVFDELADERVDGGLLLFAHYADPHQPYTAHGSDETLVRVLLDDEEIGVVDAAGLGFWEQPVEVGPGSHRLRLEAERTVTVNRMAVSLGRTSSFTLEFTAPRVTGVRAHELEFDPGADGTLTLNARVWVHDEPDRDELVERYEREVEFVDRAIGDLVRALKQRGLYESSLIVVTADHGEGLGEHGVVGHVRHLYDELLRVPLVVKLPAGDARLAQLAAQRDELVRHVDLPVTLLELVGVPPMPGMEGTSLLAKRERVLAAETHAPQAPRTLFALRDAQFKLIYEPEAERFELYDLASDPDELMDVFATRGEQRAEWVEALRAKAAGFERRDKELEPETTRMLKALGY